MEKKPVSSLEDLRKSVTLILLTCRKYSQILPYFNHFFIRHFESAESFHRLIAIDYPIENYFGFKGLVSKDSNFSNSLSYALGQVETPYVFTLIDDFIFQRDFKVSTLIRGLNVCISRNADRYIYHYPHAIFRFYKESENDIFWRLTQNSPYTTTLQWSLWSLDFLRSCIIEGEDIQSFENNGSKRINTSVKHKIFIEFDKPYHIEAYNNGRITKEFLALLKQQSTSKLFSHYGMPSLLD